MLKTINITVSLSLSKDMTLDVDSNTELTEDYLRKELTYQHILPYESRADNNSDLENWNIDDLAIIIND